MHGRATTALLRSVLGAGRVCHGIRGFFTDPLASLEALHNISWYSCAALLFAFSWLIPGQQAVGPIPGWIVQGVPTVLWGGGLTTHSA